MEENNQLDKLFEVWEKQNIGYKGAFKKDGIIDEHLYAQSKPKILFIAKEPNDPKQKEGDYRKWWKEGIKYGFSLRIAEWAYGILNNFPQYDIVRRDSAGLDKAIQSIAFLNIKKNGGNGSSNENVILEHLNRNIDLIHQEIEIINPEIIIMGITWKSIRTSLFKNAQWNESGYSIAISNIGNSKVIDFYHPSSRTAPAASYSLMQNVFRSDSFKSL